MAEYLLSTTIANPEHKIMRAGASSPNTVRVFRIDGYAVRLQIRKEKSITTVALDRDQANQLAEWLKEAASEITLDLYGKPLA